MVLRMASNSNSHFSDIGLMGVVEELDDELELEELEPELQLELSEYPDDELEDEEYPESELEHLP